ncbi:hypothetical protein NHQ30_001178, partial [Ciborinia camelliae]
MEEELEDAVIVNAPQRALERYQKCSQLEYDEYPIPRLHGMHCMMGHRPEEVAKG